MTTDGMARGAALGDNPSYDGLLTGLAKIQTSAMEAVLLLKEGNLRSDRGEQSRAIIPAPATSEAFGCFGHPTALLRPRLVSNEIWPDNAYRCR